MNDIKFGVYLHFKGYLYEVIEEGLDVDTEEIKIFYKALEDHKEGKYKKGDGFFRKKTEFLEELIMEGEKFPRFWYIEDFFNKNMEEWGKHCIEKSHMSDIKSYVTHDSYRNLLKLKEFILPFIRNILENNEYKHTQPRIPYLVKEILGDEFNIPEEIRGRINPMLEYTLDFIRNKLSKDI